MYYEEAEVKQYSRDTKKGKKHFNQIHLGQKSEFKHEEKVVVINKDSFKKIVDESEVEANQELQQQLEKVIAENNTLKKDLQELEKEKENLIQDSNNKVDTFNNNMMELAKQIEESKNNVIQLQQEKENLISETKSEVAELNYKLNNEKDFSKALLVAMNDLNKRSFFSRLFNKEPESVKQVLELKPKELPVNDISKKKK